MRIRYSVAAVFAAVIAAVLLLRHEGYLHGRVTPGPFRLFGGGETRPLDRREISIFPLYAKLDGDPVRVESVKPR
ncbi:MAG: hypothetical protein QOF76_3748, partial [Solirubrobacteraceae bacterium]|nr:hypothetical protein [Solirubrobacteraceae bacterium]